MIMGDSRRYFSSILLTGVVLLETVFLVTCNELTTTDDYLAPGSPLVGCSGKPADVVFVLDTSNSIWKRDFRDQLEFVRDVIVLFPIDSGLIRVGLVTYADFPTLHFRLGQYGRESDVQSAIAQIRHVGGYGTRTAEALHFLRDVGFQFPVPANRSNVTRVGIIVTDGLSDDPEKTRREAEKTRERGIHLFAVGVGSNRDLEELEAIASNPKQDYTILADSYKGLNKIRKLLAIKTCAVTNPTTTTTTTTSTTTTTTTTTSTATEGPRKTMSSPTRTVSLKPSLKTLVPMMNGSPPTVPSPAAQTPSMPTSTRFASGINREDSLTTTVESSRTTKIILTGPTVRFETAEERSGKPVEALGYLPGSEGKESTFHELRVVTEIELTHQDKDGKRMDERGIEDRRFGQTKESSLSSKLRTKSSLEDDLEIDRPEKPGVDVSEEETNGNTFGTAWTPRAGTSRGKDTMSTGRDQVYGKEALGQNGSTEDGASGRGSGDGTSEIKEDGKSRIVSEDRIRIGDEWFRTNSKKETSSWDGVAEEYRGFRNDLEKSKFLGKRPVFWKLDTSGRSARIWQEEFKFRDDKALPSVSNGSKVTVEGDKIWSSELDGNRSLVGEVINGSKFIGHWIDEDRRIWFGYAVMDTAGRENRINASRNSVNTVPEVGNSREGREESTAFPDKDESLDEDGIHGFWVTDEAGRPVWYRYVSPGVYESARDFEMSSGKLGKPTVSVEDATNGNGSRRDVKRIVPLQNGCRPRKPTDIAFVLDHKSRHPEVVRDIWILARAIISELDTEEDDLASFQFVHKCSDSACVDQGRYSSKADALRAVDATLQAIRKNSSHLIDKMRDSLTDTEARRRRKVGVYMTNSRSDNFDETILASDRAKHLDDIEMFAVGFGGGANPTELQAVASCPVEKHYYLLDRRLNDQTAKAVARKISRLVCLGRNKP